MRKLLLALLAVSVVALPGLIGNDPVRAVPNPVATDENTYQAFGRVFPDPHGCLAAGVPDTDGDGIRNTPRGVSPWAKGRVCAGEFLSYEEVIEGTKFMASRFKGFVEVIRLDERYKDPDMLSAGIARTAVVEDGTVKPLGRDRRPLYLFKVTDPTSTVPEADRKHFAYTLSIHGIERAGLEGGARAMEDLVTWAACEQAAYKATTPACTVEGPFPKKIVESATAADTTVPTAGQALKASVVYFSMPNPDGWARGQVAPVERRDGQVNPSYSPGFFFQRYNGNGVDVNRDFPTKGYTFKPFSPGSEPESRALVKAFTDIKDKTSEGRFAGGIDLHGMITAHAFSYTLLGAGQRDYGRNALAVDTSIRAYKDQVKRLAWSPYVADANANGKVDPDEQERCQADGDVATDTNGHVPACVADEWGTVIDTIGYQITGGVGDWIDSPLGLDGIGIDNEMYASHLAPNIVFEPSLEQTHIDGNKGLIVSQIASLLTPLDTVLDPGGQVGYVFNPERVQRDAQPRQPNPGLPAQARIEALLPCNGTGCAGGTYNPNVDGGSTFEFDIKGISTGIWNGGIKIETTQTNVDGVGHGGASGAIQLQQQDEGQWHTVATAYNGGVGYQQAANVVTANDPPAGRWRVFLSGLHRSPTRVKITFDPYEAEASPGQAAVDASSMDFFDELNRAVPDGKKLRPVNVADVVNRPEVLAGFDSLVVVNDLGDRSFLTGPLGLDDASADRYFANLRGFANGGGNLVLTDAALKAAAQIGLVPGSAVKAQNGLVGNYNFDITSGTPLTYTDPAVYPLAAGVNKPGAAEGVVGRRQAVEPTPLGYTPDTGSDATPQMPFFGLTRTAWEAACGQPKCTTALTAPRTGNVNLGEARLGAGRVRIAGILLPNPTLADDNANDHRFGVADYALTYTAYEVARNLIDYRRPS